MKVEYIGKCLLVEAEKGRRILVIGDMHLGYEAGLNVGGIRIGERAFDEVIEYLEKVFDKVGKINKIVLLGDVKQNFGEITKQEREKIIKFLNWGLEKVEEIVIVKGNHDAILEPILRGKERVKLMDYFLEKEVLFMHGNKKIEEISNEDVKLVIMGHWHPIVELSEEGGVKSERYKCFLHGKQKNREWIIVPSFSEQRHGKYIRETNFDDKIGLNSEKFEVLVVQEDDLKILEFGKLKKIK